MKISNINNVYKYNQQVDYSNYRQLLPVNQQLSFSAGSNNEIGLKIKQQLQGPLSYIAVLGIIWGSISGLTAKIEEKKANEITVVHNTSIVEQFNEEKIETAIDILDSNPELKEEYDKIMQAVNTFSEQLGEDAISLIKERVDLLGNGQVDVMDVLKILWIESNGRIYDDDGELLKSISGAYGAFQITEDTQNYLNYYFGLEGTPDELDIKNPYDNLDACIYNLRFLQDKRNDDLQNGMDLPTGNDIKTAVAWSYHDGAWADEITDYGQDYIQKYENLSRLDKYPQIINFILEG